MNKKRSLLASLVVNIVAHVLYVAGLSTVIPLLVLRFFPEQLWASVIFARSALYFAFALVLVSVVILYLYNHSVGKTFFNLGLTTFIPGILAVLFSIYNKEIIFNFVRKYVVQFELLEPYIETYLAHALPGVHALTGAYILIGVLFLFVGIRMLRGEAEQSWAKRVFGPRARIMR